MRKNCLIRHFCTLNLLLSLGSTQLTWGQTVGEVEMISARKAVPNNIPLKSVEYLDSAHHLLPSAVGAMERVETVYRDSIAGAVRVLYASGKLKSFTPFGHVRHKIRHGGATTWYESGQLHTREEYVAGKLDGERLVYYPDGTLRRKERFVDDKRTAGACLGPDGKPVPYFEYMQMPVYSEGDGSNSAVVQAIQRRTNYPEKALALRLNARVFIGFTVNRFGAVTNVRTVKEPSIEQIAPNLRQAFNKMKEAALKAAQNLKPFTPGKLDGENVAVGYTVPITFTVR